MKTLNTLRLANLWYLAGICVLLNATSLHAQPVITQQPQDQTATAGSSVTFIVVATGTEPLAYQWRSHANSSDYTNILDATSASLVLTDVQPTNRRFGVVVTDGAGLSITSLQARLTVLVPPAVVAQPASQLVVVGSAVTFSVVLTGVPAPSVQWRFNGVDLTGRTGTTLTLANVQATNSGEYTAWVTNSVGSILSAPALLTVRVPDVIYQWNATAFAALDTLGDSRRPLTRGMAMVHVAQFDAVNAVLGQFTRYSTSIVAPNAAPEAAAVQAAFAVLTNLAPGQLSMLQSALNTSLQAIPNGPAKSAGIALGQAVATQVILLRVSDASTISVPYPGGSSPGAWRPTPPGLAAAAAPHWRYVTPWTLASSSQFRLPPPPALNSPVYTRDFIEARDFGRAGSTVRTAAQTETATFHQGSSELANLMARTAFLLRPLSLAESARLFALVWMANADDYVADFETRYAYGHWRPITAITQADTDGNPDTERDAAWTPLFATPNFPEYPSGTTSTMGATAEVLAQLFGDEHTFTLRNSLTATPHTYQSFSEVVGESANGRIWAGSHWRNSCEAGEQLGRAVARHVVANFLRPAPFLTGQPLPGGFQINVAPRQTPTQVLQFSSDLVNWLPLTNYTTADQTLRFLDPGAVADPYRFYRVAAQ